MRDSSSSSTVTNQLPSSALSREVTLSASRPVISESSRRACCASFAPETRFFESRFSSATLSVLLSLGSRPGAQLLLDDLPLELLGLVLAQLTPLPALLELIELLDSGAGAVLLAIGLVGDLLSYPDRESQRRDRQQNELLHQAHAGSSTSMKLYGGIGPVSLKRMRSWRSCA